MRYFPQKKPSGTRFLITIIPLLLLAGMFASRQAPQPVGPAEPIILEQLPEPVPFLSKKTFGYSVAGRPVEGYEIGHGTDAVLFFGAIHGNEKGTADLLNRFVEEVRTHPNLVDASKKLIVIPIVNPDGYEDRTDKLNAHEVNLNLNFQTSDWAKYGPEGTFAGENPFSEPESRVLKKVVEAYHPYAMFSFHAQGTLVTPEFDPASVEWAKWYAKATGYAYFADWDFPGTATKWFSESIKKPAITIELSTYLASDWEINKPALLGIIAATSTLPLQIQKN